jgi:hemerythrin superfamily protein
MTTLTTRDVWLIRNRLLADHRELEALFEQLKDAFGANAREDTQALWTRLEQRLTRHFEAEEQLLFPRFLQVDAPEVRALEAEHRAIRTKLDELGVGVDLKLVRDDVARAFLAALEAHAAREDALLYRWADEAADEATRRALADRLTPLA